MTMLYLLSNFWGGGSTQGLGFMGFRVQGLGDRVYGAYRV